MFTSLIEWVDAGTDEAGPVQRARSRVQHLVAALLVVVGGPYTVFFQALGVWWAMAVLVPILSLGPVALLIWTRRGRPIRGGRVISTTVLIFIFGCLVARGGMMSNAAAWLLMAPIMATLIAGPRFGVFTGVLTGGLTALLWVYERTDLPMQPGFSHAWLEWLPLVDYPVMALVTACTVAIQATIWEQAEAEANRAAQARYTFLATISHEIRTPLNGVLGLTDALLASDLDPEQRQLADTVRSSGTLLRALLDDVLDYSKMDSGRLELEEVPIDLAALGDEMARLWRAPADERGLVLDVQLHHAVASHVHGDPTKVRQILGNLLANALKFTERGSVTLAISHRQEGLSLEVRDTGIGIAPEALDHIFDAFRQADGTTTRRYGGTGLGLAISRRLARFMGGSLTVSSMIGMGTTFRLTLPYRPVEAPAEPAPDTQTAVVEDALRGLRVLVAEDNPVNQMVIVGQLQRLGIEAHVVPEGNQCVAAWREQRPDLILMDCQMPLCDGYEATRQIRAEGGRLPIIALTANSMPGDRARCVDAGMDDHLGKPLETSALVEALARWAAPRRMSA